MLIVARTCYSLPRLHSCHENAFLDILQAQYQPAAESVTFHGTPEMRNGDIIISANGALCLAWIDLRYSNLPCIIMATHHTKSRLFSVAYRV